MVGLDSQRIKLRAFGFVFPLGIESSVKNVYDLYIVTSE